MRRKGLIVLAVTGVLVLTCLVGYGSYKLSTDFFTKTSTPVTPPVNVDLDALRSTIQDDQFWNSEDRVVRLIGSSMDKGREVTVDFRLDIEGDTEFTDQYTVFIPDYETDNQDEYLNYLTYCLTTDPTIANAHAAGHSVEITGTIIRWRERKAWYSQKICDFSACELDSDDKWDYTSVGVMQFFGMPHVIGLEYEIKGVELSAIFDVRDETTLSQLRIRAKK